MRYKVLALLLAATICSATGAQTKSDGNQIAAAPVETQLAAAATNASAQPRTNAALTESQLRRELALRLFRAEAFNQALGHYKVLVDAGSDQASDYYWLGESYYHLDRYAEAANAFQQAVKLDPAMDVAKVRLVEAYLAGRNLREARGAANQGLTAATDAYARRQLEVMARLASNPYPPAIPPLKTM